MDIKTSSDFILNEFKTIPDIAIVLGSGLGDFADTLENKIIIDYNDIPNFPVSTVPGHKGLLVYGELNGKKIVAMQGRFHYYEGNTLQDVVFPMQVFAYMGIKKVIITCAVGAINENYKPGDLVILKDHIKMFIDNPLRGKNVDILGERFFDMSNAYTPKLRQIALDCAKQNNIDVQEGVYAFMGGPNFETPAEIRMLRILGADVVGMSTVPEVIACAHAGIEVLAIACSCNMAAGILDQPLSHAEVLETSKQIAEKFKILLNDIIKMI